MKQEKEKIIKKSRKVTIVHYREKCIGCAACVLCAPRTWEIADDGKATLKDSTQVNNFYKGEVEQQEYEDNLEAEKSCPVKIIKLEE